MPELNTEVATADYIGAQVGNSASNVIIGKDIQRSEHVTNIYGNQLTIHDATDVTLADWSAENMRYTPKSWERVVALSAAVAWLGLIGFLVIRNEPPEPNFVALIRIILSVMAGVLGAVIPGILAIGIQGTGFKIRAGGALALFVISYFFTPGVIR